MTWIIKTPPEHRHQWINKFFERNIAGFSARNAEYEENVIRAQTTNYLPKDSSGVFFPTIWLAAYQDNVIVGAINTAVSYPLVLEVAAKQGPAYAHGVAQERRVLAGLAVREDMRGQGIGRALIEANESAAKAQGVSVLVGFFDEGNHSPSVYTSTGYSLTPRNAPLPRLGKFPIRERHPAYLKGQWFYKSPL
jgi:GNAT superfamily N-acetyltransferase